MAMERLRLLEEEMSKCFRCSCCKMVPLPTVRSPRFSDGCPVSRSFHFHGYSGSGKQLMALALCHGRIQVDQALARIAGACAACGLCDVSCKFIMEAERHQVNMALREHLVDAGFALPAHRAMMANLRETGSPAGGPRRSLSDWARDAGIRVLPGETADTLVYTGGAESNDDDSLETARKLVVLLRKAGLDVAVLGDGEPGSGLPAYWTGHREIFAGMARQNLDLIDGLGVSTVVAVSGSCLGAFRSKYPEVAGSFRAETLHAAELLDRLIAGGRLSLPVAVRAGKVAYHDPCYLGRQSEPPVVWSGETRVTHNCMAYHVPPRPVNMGGNGVYDAPRRVLRAIRGMEFVELYRIREYAFCCGGGGGLPEAYPEAARAAGLHRIEEARDVGADLLATACHHCRRGLTRSQEGSGAVRVPVADLVDLVFEAAGLEG